MIFHTSDRYLTRQVLSTAIFAVLVLSLVLVMGNLFKEINELLVERNAPVSFLGIFVLKLLPVSLVFTIPWGFLAAVLLIFGRLSADQEINSLRSAGMSLYRIALPVLILGFGLSMLCLWLNATVSPRSKHDLKNLLYEEFKGDPMRLLDPGVVQSRMKGQRIFIETRNPDNSFQGFHAYQISTEDGATGPIGYVYANHVGSVDVNNEEQKFDLKLREVWSDWNDENGNLQMALAGKAEPWVLPLEIGKKRLKADRLDNEQLRELLANPPPGLDRDKILSFDFERIRRISFSMAPFAFAFIGIPLALAARRKETSSGAGLSLVVAFGYFLFFVIADEVKSDSMVLTRILLWLPNILCILLGVYLFRRATNRA